MWIELFGNLGGTGEDETEKILKQIERTHQGIKELETLWNTNLNDSKYTKNKLERMKKNLLRIRSKVWELQNAEEALPETARIVEFIRPLKPLVFDPRGALCFAAYSTMRLGLAHILLIVIIIAIVKYFCVDWNPDRDTISKIWKKDNLLAKYKRQVSEIDENEMQSLAVILKHQREADHYAIRAKINVLKKAYELKDNDDNTSKTDNGDGISSNSDIAIEWQSLKGTIKGYIEDLYQKNDLKIVTKGHAKLFVKDYKDQFLRSLKEILEFWRTNIGGQFSEMKVSRIIELLLAKSKGIDKNVQNRNEKEKICSFYKMLLDPNNDDVVSVEEFVAFMQYFGPLDQCTTKVKAVIDAEWFLWDHSVSNDSNDPFGDKRRREVADREGLPQPSSCPLGTFGIRQSRQKGCFTYNIKLQHPDTRKPFVKKIRIFNDPGPDSKINDQKGFGKERKGGMYYWTMEAGEERKENYILLSAPTLAEVKRIIELRLKGNKFEFHPVAFKNQDMDVIMEAGGKRFVYTLGTFLQPKFRNTRLFRYFSEFSNRRRGIVHSFNEDPEIFSKVLRYYLNGTRTANNSIRHNDLITMDKHHMSKGFSHWIKMTEDEDKTALGRDSGIGGIFANPMKGLLPFPERKRSISPNDDKLLYAGANPQSLEEDAYFVDPNSEVNQRNQEQKGEVQEKKEENAEIMTPFKNKNQNISKPQEVESESVKNKPEPGKHRQNGEAFEQLLHGIERKRSISPEEDSI